jgi:hypothetical protein
MLSPDAQPRMPESKWEKVGKLTREMLSGLQEPENVNSPTAGRSLATVLVELNTALLAHGLLADLMTEERELSADPVHPSATALLLQLGIFKQTQIISHALTGSVPSHVAQPIEALKKLSQTAFYRALEDFLKTYESLKG